MTVHIAARQDLRPLTRWCAALLLPVGPVAVAVLRYVLPYDTTDDTGTIVANAAESQTALSAVLWLGLIASLTLVPAALWVGRLVRRRAPKVTAAALVLLVPGYLAIAWLTAIDAPLWSGVQAGLDRADIAALYEAGHPAFETAVGIFVAGHVLGTVLLGVALWLSNAVPRWAAVLTIVSQPLHVIAAVILASHALDLAAWGLQAVAFVAASVAIVRLSDDDWDVGPCAARTGSVSEVSTSADVAPLARS